MSELNPYTNGPLGLIFAKTAAPIIFVMGMNGLLTVVDAMFLGRYVGADALGAVTLIFPLFMLTIALATLVSNGMSSILARDLGARDLAAARAVYSSACGLALLVAGLLIAGYLLFGRLLSLTLANGVVPLADMGQTYLAITAWLSPLAFVLAVNLDALRNEGHVGMMAAMSVLVSTSNIGFNYVLIAMMGLGVAGSAIGTGLAQLLALIIIIAFRATGRTTLRPRDMLAGPLTRNWAGILALGAPQSLSFLGIAIGTAAVIAALQFNTVVEYETTVSAYGIVTRPITFAFLPLLGLTYAMQTIVGNNFGVEVDQRQIGFDHPRDHHVHPRVHLAPVIRRAVGHEQEFGPGFGQCLGHFGVPGVFADGAANAGVANGIRPAQRTRIKDAHLVKDGFIGQVVFERAVCDLPVFQDQVSIEKLRPFGPGRTNGKCGAIGAIEGQLFDVCHHIQLKRAFHDQILRIVPGDEHFGQRDQIGVGLFAFLPDHAREGSIAGKVTHGGVQLSKCDAKTVCHAGPQAVYCCKGCSRSNRGEKPKGAFGPVGWAGRPPYAANRQGMRADESGVARAGPRIFGFPFRRIHAGWAGAAQKKIAPHSPNA